MPCRGRERAEAPAESRKDPSDQRAWSAAKSLDDAAGEQPSAVHDPSAKRTHQRGGLTAATQSFEELDVDCAECIVHSECAEANQPIRNESHDAVKGG